MSESEDQRLSIIATPIKAINASYLDKAQAVQMLFTLLPREKATSYLEEHWILLLGSAKPTEIPSIVDFTRQELLPPWVRDGFYCILLRNSVSPCVPLRRHVLQEVANSIAGAH